MTIHPARRNPYGDQPSASHGHTGTRRRAAARRFDRIEDKTMESNGPPPVTKSGRNRTRSDLNAGSPALDRTHRAYRLGRHRRR
jgi:hypothetical protein